MDQHGTVLVRMDFDDYAESLPHLERYLKGDSEPVRSSFNLSFNSIVNLVGRFEEAKVREIVERSFLAWHLERKGQELQRRAERMEETLEAEGWEPGTKACET